MKTTERFSSVSVFLISLSLLAACSGSGANPSPSGANPSPSESGDPHNRGGSTSTGNPGVAIDFNLKGAIGLVTIEDSPSASISALNSEMTEDSNLKRVNTDNSLTDAVTSGNVVVQNFMVAAGNQVYLLLKEPFDSCLLVQVDGTTDEATCVDSTLASIVWNNAFGDPIQFDANGTIYYEGMAADGRTVLRQNAFGEVKDLINDYIALQGFLVLDDGTVFLAGETTPTGSEWTRMIKPDGSLENLLTLQPDFMALFPDDNIYYGSSSKGIKGVGRYLTASGDFDPQAWITEDGSEAYYDCPVESSNCGFVQSAFLRTTTGRIYATVPNENAQRILVQYYPVVDLPDTAVTDVTISKTVLTYLILAGMDGDAANKLVLHDTNTDTETDLLNSENIEAYHLNYMDASGNQIIMFDGLRFSDNSYVLCQVNLTDGNTLLCSKTGTNKLTDFQLFNAN